jgi:type II secretory pathway pseudopilin PulG
MTVRFRAAGVKALEAFTLVEVVIAFAIMVTALSGVFYAYVQANRFAELSSMSLAAQSYAAQGLERARAAQWNYEAFPYTNGPGTGDELPPGTNASTYSFYETNTLDVPQTGAPFYITNFIYVTTNQYYPPLREIRSVVTWTFPLTKKVFTNSLVTFRAPDE